MTNWLTMTADLFDKDPQPVQGALFPQPDPMGTGDLADLLADPEATR